MSHRVIQLNWLVHEKTTFYFFFLASHLLIDEVDRFELLITLRLPLFCNQACILPT